jgi:predicted RNase H-like nuclease (RuvC/YqgF family)
MSNLLPIIMSVLGGGTVTGAVTAGRWVMDERARRHAEKSATVRAPLIQRSLELRVAAQADEILQETISTLRENQRELKEQFAQYRRDTDDQRRRDLEEHERLRRLDHEELDRARAEIEELNQRIIDQDSTIAALKLQLQRAGGP